MEPEVDPNQEITGHIEQWYKDPYFKIIWGNVENDIRGRFADGTFFRTSIIVEEITDEDGILRAIRTLNSFYTLGAAKTKDE